MSDIEQHEFYDGDINRARVSNDFITLDFDYYDLTADFTKDDVKAMELHFGLIEEEK